MSHVELYNEKIKKYAENGNTAKLAKYQKKIQTGGGLVALHLQEGEFTLYKNAAHFNGSCPFSIMFIDHEGVIHLMCQTGKVHAKIDLKQNPFLEIVFVRHGTNRIVLFNNFTFDQTTVQQLEPAFEKTSTGVNNRENYHLKVHIHHKHNNEIQQESQFLQTNNVMNKINSVIGIANVNGGEHEYPDIPDIDMRGFFIAFKVAVAGFLRKYQQQNPYTTVIKYKRS